MIVHVDKKGHYPTVKELKKAFDRVRDLTGDDNLQILGGNVLDDTVINRIVILTDDGVAWNGRMDGKPSGIFLG